MKTIDTYIKEAFITKDNIKQISQAAKDAGAPYIFLPVGNSTPDAKTNVADIYKRSFRFSELDELLNYFNYSVLVPSIFRYSDGDVKIKDIHTEETPHMAKVITEMPEEYKSLCQQLYGLRVDFIPPSKAIEKHLTGKNFFIGNINCTAEELK